MVKQHVLKKRSSCPKWEIVKLCDWKEKDESVIMSFWLAAFSLYTYSNTRSQIKLIHELPVDCNGPHIHDIANAVVVATFSDKNVLYNWKNVGEHKKELFVLLQN